MGRWSQFHVQFQWPKISELDAAKIADAHNREMAELRAELARVKAESLRVVPVPDGPPFVDHDWYITYNGELGWWGVNNKGERCVETPHGYHDRGDCKPVRLERWEATA